MLFFCCLQKHAERALNGQRDSKGLAQARLTCWAYERRTRMDKPDVVSFGKRLEISLSHARKLARLLGTVEKHLKSGALPNARTSLRPCVELEAGVTDSLVQIGADLDAPITQYLQSAEYFADVSVKCKELRLELRNDGDTWYCFPSTIKVFAEEEIVVINSNRTSEVLPANIAAKLKT